MRCVFAWAWKIKLNYIRADISDKDDILCDTTEKKLDDLWVWFLVHAL